jgi:hypothetical protein
MSDEENNKDIRALLRHAMAPVKDAELQRDLWAQMLHRLDKQPFRVPWFDWALAAILVATLFLSPDAIPTLLYHL